MQQIRLPYETMYVCEICGRTGPQNLIARCEEVQPWEKSEVQVGQQIALYKRTWRGGRYAGLSKGPENMTVSRLFYAHAGQLIGLGGNILQPKHHQLCIDLTSCYDAVTKQVLPPADQHNPGADSTWTQMTFAELLLWHQGDRAELELAGLIAPLTPQKTQKLSWLFRR